MRTYKIPGITPEGYARELLRELNVPFVPPIDLRDICTKLNIQISYRPLENATALLLRAPAGGAKIVLGSSNKYFPRDNFSIAHELGHYFLPGHQQSQRKCNFNDIFHFNSSAGIENEANRFAAELLLPTPWLKARIKTVDVTLPLIISIAEECEASLAATAIRITRICTDRVGIAYSEEGVIKWTARSKSFPYYLRKGPVSSTFVNGFFANSCLSGELYEIHPSSWVDAPYHHDFIYEQSAPMPYLGAVLTVLTLPFNDDDEEFIDDDTW